MRGKALTGFISLISAAACFVFTAGNYANAHTINGTIYQGGGVTMVTDAAIQVAVVSGNPCAGHQAVYWSAPTSAGLYSITDVPDGDYFLLSDNQNDSDYVNEWWNGGAPDPSHYACACASPPFVHVVGLIPVVGL